MTNANAPLAAVLVAALIESATAGGADPARAIGDKTLVAWVSVADLAQRGGAVVTLIDKAERFDAIVFGEVAPAKWMAGSDFFRRTPQDQSSWPGETAGAATPIEIAITYRGDRVTLFRDGREYAAYHIDRAQPFGDDAMVLIGLRFIGAMGEIGFFAGAIDDVRIYDTALSPEEIAALAPQRLSDPPPVAWWTFEDGTAKDSRGTFTAVRCEGSARIADGKLILDGGGYLWAARDPRLLVTDEEAETSFDASEQSMFYCPRSRRSGVMLDTWLYLHEGTYYLYYLARSRGQWDNISLATSTDGVHWKEQGRVLAKRRGVTWMGTGSTWRSPDFAASGTFCMNFSEWKGPRQTIFFAVSKDLRNWTRLGDEHEFVQDERWYERDGRWDCIWTIPRRGGGLHGYFTATPKGSTGGRFGFAESPDGVTWRALEPPTVLDVGEGEVGAIERIGDAYYMMFGTGGIMVTLLADRPEGPFRPAAKNFRLLSGHTYFSRFFPTAGGLLVNHHSIARDGGVFFGALKTALLDAEGTLRLGWWKGNEAMKKEKLTVRPSDGDPSGWLEDVGAAPDIAQGIVLEGTLRLPEAGDVTRHGLFLECAGRNGAAILIDAAGVAHLGTMRGDGSGFAAEKRVDRAMRFGAPARFRLLFKRSLLEFYLDDVLIECFSLPGEATGRMGFVPRGGRPFVENLQAWGS